MVRALSATLVSPQLVASASKADHVCPRGSQWSTI